MEGMFLPEPGKSQEPVPAETQRLHRAQGRLLDLMLERVETQASPDFTREVVFERINSVKDDLPSCLALLDYEISLHPEPIHDQWGFDPRR